MTNIRLDVSFYIFQLQRKRDSAIELKRASLTQQQENGEVNGEVVANDEVKKMIKENEQLHKELSDQETKFRSEVCINIIIHADIKLSHTHCSWAIV